MQQSSCLSPTSHMRMETDPVSEMLSSLVFKIPDNGEQLCCVCEDHVQYNLVFCNDICYIYYLMYVCYIL
jgi:hypothetical protein